MAIKFLDEETLKKSNIRFVDDEDTALQGTKALAGATKAIANPITTAKDPKASALLALNALQVGGQAALPWASGISTTPATEFAMQKIKGQPTSQALKQAGIAGGLDLALTGGGALAVKAGKAAIKKAVPLMTGISEEATQSVLKNPSILKGKSNLETTFNNLGEKAQKAANYIQQKAGSAVGKEREALKNIKDNFNFEDISNNIDNLVQNKAFGRESVLDAGDVKEISNFSDKIRRLSQNNGMTAGELYAIRKQIDETLKFNPQVVKKTTGEGDNVLRQSRELINNKLYEISPKFEKVSKKYNEMTTLKDEVIPKLKNVQAATNIKNVFKKAMNTDEPVAYLDEFKQLDRLVPKRLKFADEASNALINKQFNEWSPKSGLLHNIRLSGALLGGGYGIGTGNMPLAIGAGVLGAASIPKTYKTLITAGVAAKRAANQPLVQGATKNLATRVSEMLQNRGQQ